MRVKNVMCGVAGLAMALALPFSAAFAIGPETVIYTFTGGADGASPGNWLTLDKAGHLWGTAETGSQTFDCGTSTTYKCGGLFKLTPHGTKTATLHTELEFQGSGEGAAPAGLLLGAGGGFYGVTYNGGVSSTSALCSQQQGCGIVFKLTSTSTGWVRTTLYNFTGLGDGGSPVPGLVQDAAGNLYGATSLGGGANVGVVFELKKPAKAGAPWKQVVLHDFTGGLDGGTPSGPLVADGAGHFFGPASTGGIGSCPNSCGVVYELSPSGKSWSYSVAYSFAGYWASATDGALPSGHMVFDTAGNLYGVTWGGGSTKCGVGCGTVFEMSPSPTGWTETTLYAFNGGSDGVYPMGGLIMTSKGQLWGVAPLGGKLGVCVTGDGADDGCGTLFMLQKSSAPGSVYQIGNIYDFQGGSTDGSFPLGHLVETPNGILYGVTSEGGSGYCQSVTGGCGAIYEFNPADIGN